MAKAKKAKSVAKPKKKGRQPDKAVASDTPRSQVVRRAKYPMISVTYILMYKLCVYCICKGLLRPPFEPARTACATEIGSVGSGASNAVPRMPAYVATCFCYSVFWC